MTKDDQIAFIREKCIAANPDSFGGGYDDRSIRLADVLLAMPGYSPGARIIAVDHEGTFAEWSKGAFRYCGKLPQWNLHNDDLTQQNDETITFLYGLLAN